MLILFLFCLSCCNNVKSSKVIPIIKCVALNSIQKFDDVLQLIEDIKLKKINEIINDVLKLYNDGVEIYNKCKNAEIKRELNYHKFKEIKDAFYKFLNNTLNHK